MELSTEIKQQIEQEAASDASSYGYAPGTEVDEDLQSVYRYAAGKYGDKWQAAEQRAERYEKALKEIAGYSGLVPPKQGMIDIAREALTPKTGSDEQ